MTPRAFLRRLAFAGVLACSVATLRPHESTLHTLLAQMSAPGPQRTGPTVPLTIELVLDDGTPVTGLVHVVDLATGNPVRLPAYLGRPMNWYSIASGTTVQVPPGRLLLSAFHGLETEQATATIDTSASSGNAPQRTRLILHRFYDAHARRLVAANTHLHLMLTTTPNMGGAMLRNRREAEDYLRATGASDGLDLVYVSKLLREGENERYISNEFTREDFAGLSDDRLRFVNGEEHRHEGGRFSQRAGPEELRYGHVLFLDLPQIVEPVSYGAILTRATASDAVPMRRAIQAARDQRATIVWCHGRQGVEDVPNWLAGLLDAQNIFDGGSVGTYEEVFYPLLNAGLRLPFSTGTDWGVYDLSRVYVAAAAAPTTSATFLGELRGGHSFITNGPLLEFDVAGRHAGDTVALAAAPGTVHIRGRAIGRDDFIHLEVVFNGKVVAQVERRPVENHFVAEVDITVPVTEAGWFALRIPTLQPYNDHSQYSDAGTNALGKALFAHTSPVYVTVAGKTVRAPEAIRKLRDDLDASVRLIEAKGAFASPAERDTLLAIYRDALTKLEN